MCTICSAKSETETEPTGDSLRVEYKQQVNTLLIASDLPWKNTRQQNAGSGLGRKGTQGKGRGRVTDRACARGAARRRRPRRGARGAPPSSATTPPSAPPAPLHRAASSLAPAAAAALRCLPLCVRGRGGGAREAARGKASVGFGRRQGGFYYSLFYPLGSVRPGRGARFGRAGPRGAIACSAARGGRGASIPRARARCRSYAPLPAPPPSSASQAPAPPSAPPPPPSAAAFPNRARRRAPPPSPRPRRRPRPPVVRPRPAGGATAPPRPPPVDPPPPPGRRRPRPLLYCRRPWSRPAPSNPE